jgi:hypothetical protein
MPFVSGNACWDSKKKAKDIHSAQWAQSKTQKTTNNKKVQTFSPSISRAVSSNKRKARQFSPLHRLEKLSALAPH